MKPLVITAQSIGGLKDQIQEKVPPGGGYTLAIVFASANHDLNQLLPILSEACLDVFAANSGAEIAGAQVLEESITMMLLDIDRSVYQVKLFELTDGDSRQMGRAVASWATGVFPKPAIIVIPASFELDGDLLIEGITEQAGDQTMLFGGFASYDVATLPRGTAPLVSDARQTLAQGMVALAFDSESIEIRGIAAAGWKGVGTVKTITKSTGNVVFEIDGQPAHDVINRYLEIGDDADLAIEYPLCWIREDGTTVLRGVVAFNPDKSIVYAGTVPQGAKVRLGFPPGMEVIDEAVNQMKTLQESGSSLDAVILFSCLARYTALGPLVEDEVEAINRLWSKPQLGFYTFGEIGPGLQGHCDFHNTTTVAVLISQTASQAGEGS